GTANKINSLFKKRRAKSTQNTRVGSLWVDCNSREKSERRWREGSPASVAGAPRLFAAAVLIFSGLSKRQTPRPPALAAVRAFNLDEWQRKRLLVWERL